MQAQSCLEQPRNHQGSFQACSITLQDEAWTFLSGLLRSDTDTFKDSASFVWIPMHHYRALEAVK